MAVKFQYNKTSLQELNKQLKVRVRALPTIKNKESALRAEVKKAKDEADGFEQKLQKQIETYEYMRRLWVEFNPELIAIKDVHIKVKKIAGVKIPILDRIDFEVKPFSLFNNPGWIQDGITILEVLATTAIEREFLHRKMVLLDFARKKTTQKVNLYEKIQIPGFEEAILKIKRFMEDEENLSKSSQKIVKTRQQLEEEAV
jgi:V/A-type H+-transporting ATPase subunit D